LIKNLKIVYKLLADDFLDVADDDKLAAILSVSTPSFNNQHGRVWMTAKHEIGIL
jgi:hypothetical protein